MTDRPKTTQKDSSAIIADEQIAAYLDYLQTNNVALVSETVLLDSVQTAVRTIQVQRDRSEGTKLHARLCGSIIQDRVREVQNHPNQTLILNCLWAAFDLGMILSPERSPKEIERIRAKTRSEMGRLGGKSSVERRRENWPWRTHAEELALKAYSDDPTRSNEKVAEYISDTWKLAVKCPVHGTLAKFVAEFRSSGRLPKRTRSLPKRTRSLQK